MTLLATDLDRTLLPNGKEEYDNTLSLFKKIIKNNKINLAYVTGKNLNLAKKAIKKYNLPYPDYLIGNVGTKIYKYKNKKLNNDLEWEKTIKKLTPKWNIKKMKKILRGIKGLKLQEKSKQDIFKLSYYVDLKKQEKILKQVKEKLKKEYNCKIIYSIDFPEIRGLLDIIPQHATKKWALDYIAKKVSIPKKQIIFCGDSGNDLPILTSHYKLIVVRNARDQIKLLTKKIKKQKKDLADLFIARKQKYLNGNYVSGIIQGLIYYKIISKNILK